jgi:excisionase family DNA binding protein
MTERWVSVDVLAEHLGVKRDSVYRWIERKGLPARKVGKLWKFKLSEVDEWVRAGAGGSMAPRTPADK